MRGYTVGTQSQNGADSIRYNWYILRMVERPRCKKNGLRELVAVNFSAKVFTISKVDQSRAKKGPIAKI